MRLLHMTVTLCTHVTLYVTVASDSEIRNVGCYAAFKRCGFCFQRHHYVKVVDEALTKQSPVLPPV